VEEYIKLGFEGRRHAGAAGQASRRPRPAKGFFITPTIFTDVDNSHAHRPGRDFRAGALRHQVRRLEDAIRMANDTIYGLAAGVWSRDTSTALSVARRIQAGTVWINDYHLINAEAPFGGYKQSGIGRELGTWGLKEYLEVKHIHVPLNNARGGKFWFDIVVPQEN
jgi:acyl-CoA reductase-like NAD-dependent aldehyde dehydrogenase